MVKMRASKFATPKRIPATHVVVAYTDTNVCSLPAAKKFPITALHESNPTSNKADCAVAQR
jgi:hypothetical protein